MALDAVQDQHPLEGLRKDAETGHYQVDSGYSHQASRYKMNESWLDEDDNLWIDGAAVDRERDKADTEAGS